MDDQALRDRVQAKTLAQYGSVTPKEFPIPENRLPGSNFEIVRVESLARRDGDWTDWDVEFKLPDGRHCIAVVSISDRAIMLVRTSDANGLKSVFGEIIVMVAKGIIKSLNELSAESDHA